MISLGEALVALVGGGSPPAVAAPLYAEKAPQDARAPYLIYEIILVDRWASLDGPSGVSQSSITIECRAPGKAACDVLAKQLRLCLDNYRGTVTGPNGTLKIRTARCRDEGTAEESTVDPALFVVTQEYLITHEEDV